MTATYRVYVQEVGGLAMLEATAQFDAAASNLPRAARERATEGVAHFKFPQDEIGVPDIREGAELWAGWVNDTTGDFLPMPRPFGGFIMQSEGSAVGPTHHIHCTLSSYGILLQKATVIGWPTGETLTAIPTAGFPGGFAVSDWLAGGGGGYAGLLPTYLPGMDTTGIDPMFGTLIWTELNKPGTPDPDVPFKGQWAFTTVDEVLQDLMGGVRAVWPGIQPIYWVEAIGNGTQVVARFRLIDREAGSGVVKATFSTDPVDGELYIE